MVNKMEELRKVVRFKPHQRGGGCCSFLALIARDKKVVDVSNPISGEVGAAARP